MSISEQVKELREYAEYHFDEAARLTEKAADTIEPLSAKLQAAEYCGDCPGIYITEIPCTEECRRRHFQSKNTKKSVIGLRPCIVEIREETIENRGIHGERHTKVIKEAETHKGYFHTWSSEAYVTNGYLVGTTAGQMSTLYGVVEYEDGTVHRVPPECIVFTDREVEPHEP